MSMLQEFKTFAMRGNVVDLAVGVVIGGAFGGIVTSLVGDLIMPVVGILTGGIDFSKAALVLKEGIAASPDGKVPAVAPVLFGYGKFIQTVINFIIVAWAIFLLVKVMNKIHHKEAPPPAPPTPSEKLLTDIRDLLAKQKS